ncbi:MAG: hypothetical protein HFG70_13485 [Hungatella sp.]|nr:hypothetical protein [Hungatella sp.]
MTAAWMVMGAIAGTVFYGYKTRHSVAPPAITLAYVIGCGVLKLPPSKILGFMPVSTMFNMFAITFFFGFAIENGTLAALTKAILYRIRFCPALTLPALFFISFLVALSGAGIAAAAFMAPIAFFLVEGLQIPSVAAYGAVTCGTVSGSNFMYSGGGLVLTGLIEDTEFKEAAFLIAGHSFLLSALLCGLFFGIIYLHFRCWNCRVDENQKPADWTPVQRQTLALLLVVALLVLIPKLWAEMFPGKGLAKAAKYIEVSFFMVCGGCIAAAMGLGDDKTVIRRQVPWTTIVMLGSMSLLIGVGKEAGMVELLASMISHHLPVPLLAVFLALAAGIMSMFSSAIGVVLPTLFPLVPELVRITGVPGTVLFMAVFVGATLTGISPMSTTGSMVLAGGRTEEERSRLFYQVIILPFLILGMVMAVCFFLQMAKGAAVS